MVIEPSGCKKQMLAYFSFTWFIARTAALHEKYGDIRLLHREGSNLWMNNNMYVFKQNCHNVLRGRTEPTSSFSLPILFLDLSIQQRTGEWLTWHLSTHFSPLPSCSGRTAGWAEAVSILMLLASLLIRLFFKRTKQIIQSESKSIKQWLWFSPLLFRNNKEENHKSSEYILLVFHSPNPDTEVTCFNWRQMPSKKESLLLSKSYLI